jgi:protein-L-isoaspartate(D-aspartate) O-methyltransferase
MNINFEKNREVMIENQLRPNKITNIDILGVFNKVSKEKFIKEDKVNVCYSDQDILVKDARGYLKNLHLAQILHFADIKAHEKVLHIGGLTGYLSVLIAKLCNEIYVIDNDEECVDQITKNFKDNNIKNGYVCKQNLTEGLAKTSPYNLIVIDCPQYKLNLDLLNQLHDGGKIVYIEKINEELSKGYKITKMNDNYSKDFLFDVFSNFYLTQKEEGFSF